MNHKTISTEKQQFWSCCGDDCSNPVKPRSQKARGIHCIHCNDSDPAVVSVHPPESSISLSALFKITELELVTNKLAVAADLAVERLRESVYLSLCDKI